jgi:hypothetical protein
MNSPRERGFLRGKCKQMMLEYSDVLDEIEKEVQEDIDRERISGESSFEYAKKVIKKEGIKEGLSLFKSKINKYASERA